jgi:hypothetical protein
MVREEHTLRAFQNRVLGKIFGYKREVIGGWQKLHHEKLHLYFSPIIIRVIKSRRMR